MALPHGDGNLQREAELTRLASEIEHPGSGPNPDPGRPHRQRGDRAETLALLICTLAGGVIGILVAIVSPSVNIFTGGIPGLILGAIVGVLVGSRLKKRAESKAS